MQYVFFWLIWPMGSVVNEVGSLLLVLESSFSVYNTPGHMADPLSSHVAYILVYFSTDQHWMIGHLAYMWHFRGIFVADTFCSSTVKRMQFIFYGSMQKCGVYTYVEYSRSAVGHICAMWQVNFSGEYASNVECMYTNVPGHIFHCSEFMFVYIYLCMK